MENLSEKEIESIKCDIIYNETMIEQYEATLKSFYELHNTNPDSSYNRVVSIFFLVLFSLATIAFLVLSIIFVSSHYDLTQVRTFISLFIISFILNSISIVHVSYNEIKIKRSYNILKEKISRLKHENESLHQMISGE